MIYIYCKEAARQELLSCELLAIPAAGIYEMYSTYVHLQYHEWQAANYSITQGRNNAKLFSSRRNLDSPNPSHAGECAPPTPRFWGGGAHSLARERLGESQFRRGDIHCGTLYIYVLCAPASP